MSLLEQIKADQLAARKNRDAIKSTLLTTLLGEAKRPGEDDGKRPSTDDEVSKVITKFLKGVNETIALVNDEAKLVELKFESSVYQAYLPERIEGEVLKAYIRDIVASAENLSIGSVMAELKKKVTFEGKEATGYIKELLAK